MRVWLWWSSGKDSAWALHRLRQDPSVSVERLVTTGTASFDRVAIHGTRFKVLEAQAASVGLPVERVDLPFPCSNDEYEAAVAPVLEKARSVGVEAMAFGDLFLEDVRAYRERLLQPAELRPVFPLWGEDTVQLAAEMLTEGLEARVTSLDPNRIDRSYAAMPYNADFIAALPDSVDPCGENGEFHTCVTSGPMFTEPLALRTGDVVERGGFVYADLLLEDGVRGSTNTLDD